MKKIFINIFIIFILFFLSDYCVFYLYKYKYKLSNNQTYIENLTKKTSNKKADEKYMDIVKQVFRKPINEQNKKKSIVFTGCSNIYGWGLKENETVSYQLSKYVKNPIYNFAYPGWGLNNTLYLIKSKILFDLIKKEPKIVIYSWADFHVQRGIVTFSPIEMNEFMFDLNNGKVERKPQSYFISRSALLSLIKEKIVNYMLNRSEIYRKKQIELNTKEFLECKKLLESKYKNIKFIILLMYDENFYAKEYFNNENFSKELEENGFIIINMKEITGITFNEKYKQSDGHPNAEYWKDVMPKFARKLEEYL